jgi:alpha-1,2-mannosyltransferase
VSDLQPRYADHSNWTVAAEFEFLDGRASHPFFRAFYVPWVSRKFSRYNRYLLLGRRQQAN